MGSIRKIKNTDWKLNKNETELVTKTLQHRAKGSTCAGNLGESLTQNQIFCIKYELCR